jgi:hypothetical protein
MMSAIAACDTDRKPTATDTLQDARSVKYSIKTIA